MLALATIAAAYGIGSIPVAYLAGRLATGVDIRTVGSGNVGASNVWQSVAKWLVVPVGVTQIGQGLAGVLLAKALDQGDGVQVSAGVAALIAHNWSPWIGFSGGRGVGVTIGVLLAVSPVALAVFIAIALAGVAAKMIPQGVGLGLAVAPLVALAAGQPGTVITGCAALVVVVAAKRVTANGAPAPVDARPAVWWTRLVYDRDTPDRDAWVRRGLEQR